MNTLSGRLGNYMALAASSEQLFSQFLSSTHHSLPHVQSVQCSDGGNNKKHKKTFKLQNILLIFKDILNGSYVFINYQMGIHIEYFFKGNLHQFQRNDPTFWR